LDAYRTTYRDINRTEAPPPVCAGWTFCDENPARAHEMARRYIGGYYQTVLDHYNFQGDHLAKTKGYEYYGKMAEKIAQYGTDKVIEYFMNLQVWGTPEQCYEKILDVRGRVGNDTFVGVFSYAGMDYGEAERHMRLFARTVMPQLQQLPPAAAPAPAAAAPRAGNERGVAPRRPPSGDARADGGDAAAGRAPLARRHGDAAPLLGGHERPLPALRDPHRTDGGRVGQALPHVPLRALPAPAPCRHRPRAGRRPRAPRAQGDLGAGALRARRGVRGQRRVARGRGGARGERGGR